MFRYVLTSWIASAFAFLMFHPPQKDVAEVLARSEALYYEAKFSESIELLTTLEESLDANTGYSRERATLNLQLALGYLALNDLAKAKSYFVEMCNLEPMCTIDGEKYPPKVLLLFEEAKMEHQKNTTPAPTPPAPPPPPDPSPPPTLPAKDCVQMDVHAVMLRVLESRKPEIPAALDVTRNVRVVARIGEDGDVRVTAVRGDNTDANRAARRAVEHWKFSPLILENEPRCVETVFPIFIEPRAERRKR